MAPLLSSGLDVPKSPPLISSAVLSFLFNVPAFICKPYASMHPYASMPPYASMQDQFLPQRSPTWASIERKHERPKALLRQKAAKE